MNEPTHLDIFSGIGGFTLAAQWAGFRTIGFCEIDNYCQKVLAKNFISCRDNSKLLSEWEGTSQRSNQEEEGGNIPSLCSNIFDLNGRDFYGVDLITGGFPCQPFSVAGKRRGAADDRAIWPEMFRVIKEARPAWVLGENVPGIIPMELDNVLSDLESICYATRAFVIPACAVDARHRRDRLWVVGKRIEPGLEGYAGNGDRRRESRWKHSGSGGSISEAGLSNGCQWEPEPGICRVVNGLRNRVDRLKGLGNAIVPQVAYEILREIRKLI